MKTLKAAVSHCSPYRHPLSGLGIYRPQWRLTAFFINHVQVLTAIDTRAWVSADLETLSASGCSQTTSKKRSNSSWLAPLRKFSKNLTSCGGGSLRSRVNAVSSTRWRAVKSADAKVLLMLL